MYLQVVQYLGLSVPKVSYLKVASSLPYLIMHNCQAQSLAQGRGALAYLPYSPSH